MIDEALLDALRAQDSRAQKRLYERYSPLLYSVCRRYLKAPEDAEEALISGFYKIFAEVDSYNGNGSFEGWMRRIAANEALMLLRKRRDLVFPGDERMPPESTDDFSIEADLSAREILQMLDQLPDGYRTVFNLYVLEGFKHREIADLLGISLNTSKSQLALAKERLRQLLIAKGY